MFVLSSLARRCAFVGALLLGVGGGRAHAANFVVTNTSDASGTCGTSSCSLRQAITSANTDASTSDTITFASSVTGTISLSASDSDTTDGASALILKGDVWIQGPGANVLTVQRTTSASSFRLFLISSGVNARITGLTLSKGSSGSGVPGGGFFNRGSLSLSDCVVTGNTASTYGGAIYNTGTLSVQNSTISANTASGGGTSGGIDNGSGTDSPVGAVTLVNSTLSGNTASSTAGRGSGGALWTGNGATISNCTISNNGAGNGASGIFAVRGTVTLSNTIVAANQSNTTLPDLASDGGAFASGGYNLIGNVGSETTLNGSGDLTGTASSTLNPKLGALANNGGATLTQALLAGSPAINAGNPTFDPTIIAYDQRGVGYARVGNSRLDVGAFEVPSDAPVVNSVTITPTNPKTDDTLTAQVKGNSSTLTYTYQWNKNDTPLANETGATLDLKTEGNGDAGDEISVTVVAKDGTRSSAPVTSKSVTIVNSGLTITNVAITPANPKTNTLLTASADVNDADGGTPTKTYQWKKNDTPIDEATSETLDLSQAGNGDKGDTISVIVTASDGTISSSVESPPVTVGNTAPLLSDVSISPSNPTTDAVLAATSVASDVDGADNGNLTYSYQWFKNGAALANETFSTLNLATAGNGDSGDTISVSITISDGTAIASSEAPAVTVVNSVPVLSSVSITPTDPATNTLLTANVTVSDADDKAGTSLKYAYQWKKNNVDISGATNATLDLSAPGSGDKGDSITVSVTVSDATSSSQTVTPPAVTVLNSAPVISTLSITPATASTSSTLSLTLNASDADNDALTYSYQWRKNGVDISGATGKTLSLATAGNGDRGDKITVVVTISDGSTVITKESLAVTIGNSLPIVSKVTITPAGPRTNNVMSATIVATDADKDALTYTYQWKKNKVSISGATTDKLDLSKLGNGDKGDKITLAVTASDGIGRSFTTISSSVTILNSAPAISKVSLSPDPLKTNSLLKATVAATDADNDKLTYSYQWKKNKVALQGATGATLDLSVAGNGDKGDEMSVTVTAFDGTNRSYMASSPILIVGNAAPDIESVTLSPTNPKVGESVVATVGASDPDGDGITYVYTWSRTRNGQKTVLRTATKTPAGDGASANTSTQVVTSGTLMVGDVLTVSVVAKDASGTSAAKSASVIIANSPVTVSITNRTPAAVTTNSVITITVASQDADKTPATYSYSWSKVSGGKTTVLQTSTSNSITSSLDLSKAGNGNKGDSILFSVTASDGASSATASQNIAVGNSLPSMTKVTLSPTSPQTTSKIVASVTTNDDDAKDGVDKLTLFYKWTIGTRFLSSETTSTLDLSKYNYVKAGDTVTLEVRASDGTATSATLKATAKVAGTTTKALSPSAPDA